MATLSKSRIVNQIKTYSTEQAVSYLVSLFPRASNENLIRAGYWLERLAKTETKKATIRTVRKAFENNHPVIQLARRLLNQLHPNCKRGIAAFIVQSIFAEAEKRKDYFIATGVRQPFVTLISPTMRCNLHCRGCYASNYHRSSDMKVEIFDSILSQCKDLGIHFITILGGEPFIYRYLLEVFSRHKDLIFQVFTNGTLISSELAQRIVELGNVVPVISLEGFEAQTDNRRGAGTFAAVMEVMDNLRKAGALFFYSVTTTRENYETVVSDAFIEMLIEKGAVLGWYFNYMPVGREPDFNYMPLPEQRNFIRRRVNEIRATKPLLLVDFWGDGPLVDGCLAGGKLYLHITNNGDVEPCIFAHYAVDNIKEKSLFEVLNSNFFKGIRKMQPFGHNDIRPCPLIDHPGAMRYLVKKYGARPTHEGAEVIIEDLIPRLRQYSREVARIYKPIWEKEYQWARERKKVAEKDPFYCQCNLQETL